MSRKRSKNRRHPPPTILILSEDTGSGKDYLEKTFRSNSKVKIIVIGVGKDPKNLIKYASRALKPDDRKYGPADYVFLCFDRDQRGNFDDYIRQISKLPRIVAFSSSPCLEYYWQLHFEFSTASKKAAEMPTYLQKFEEFKRYNKSVGSAPVVKLAELQNTAIDNCKQARDAYRKSGSSCPFSDMDLLVKYINLAKFNGIAALSNIKDDTDFYHPDQN